MEFNIDKFNPTKAELIEMVDTYGKLTIKDATDVAGYVMVDMARKDLKAKRVEITKRGKVMREGIS